MISAIRPGKEASSVDRGVEELCRIYWPAVYASLRRQGLREVQAAEVAQGFFADVVLDRGLFARAQRQRGRLRSLISRSLQNYQIDLSRRTPGTTESLSGRLSDDDLQWLESQIQTAPEAPEQAFDLQWATALLAEGLRQTERHFAKTGQTEKWAAFESHVIRPIQSGNAPIAQTLIAEEIGLDAAGTVANAVFAVRKHLQMRLEELLASTVEPEEYEAERAHFLEQLAQRRVR